MFKSTKFNHWHRNEFFVSFVWCFTPKKNKTVKIIHMTVIWFGFSNFDCRFWKGYIVKESDSMQSWTFKNWFVSTRNKKIVLHIYITLFIGCVDKWKLSSLFYIKINASKNIDGFVWNKICGYKNRNIWKIWFTDCE